jgi:3-oxoacyl-[acyl-carrier protein] reductase
MELDLKGRAALVTGASSGIGRAIALELGNENARLAITGRRRENLEQVAAQVAAMGAPKPVVIVHDALDEGYVDALVTQSTAALGAVDILVNNAGGSRAFGKDATEAQWAEAMTLNFTVHRQLANRLLPAMVEKRWGRIVNIIGKFEPEGVNGAFSAKAGLARKASR